MLATITTVIGCTHAAAGGGAGTPATASPAPSDGTAPVRIGPIPVSVENRSTRDVVVYAVSGSIQRRLGNVPGLSRASLTVPDTFTSDRGGGFSLAAVPIAGGERFVSDRVTPQVGVRLVLTLEARLAGSALSVVGQ